MNRTLRGHHLLCVHGFEGMGYSPEFVKKMDEVVQDIRNEEKDFFIKVVVDLDEACSECPHNGGSICVASEGSDRHVKSMDRRVLDHLGLIENDTYKKSTLVKMTTQLVKPDDLDHLCKNCSWLPYGVCKNGIKKLNELNRVE